MSTSLENNLNILKAHYNEHYTKNDTGPLKEKALKDLRNDQNMGRISVHLHKIYETYSNIKEIYENTISLLETEIVKEEQQKKEAFFSDEKKDLNNKLKKLEQRYSDSSESGFSISKLKDDLEEGLITEDSVGIAKTGNDKLEVKFGQIHSIYKDNIDKIKKEIKDL